MLSRIGLQNFRLPFQRLLGAGQFLRLPFDFERGVSPLRNVCQNPQKPRRIPVARMALGVHQHPPDFAAADDDAVFDFQNIARVEHPVEFLADRIAIAGMDRRKPSLDRGSQYFDRKNRIFGGCAGVVPDLTRFHIQLPDEELSVLERQPKFAVA